MINFSDDIFYLMIQFCLGFIITFAFAIFFNAPKKSLIDCSLIGAMAWLVYIWGRNLTGDIVVGTLIAAVLVGLAAGNASKRLKMPATVFIYTGIIPLIPGYGLYYTMHHIVTKNYIFGAKTGVDTLLQAGAIAIGILLASVFSDSIRRVKIQRRKK
ncbi:MULTISPECIES: threonine/serine exporter family protein [unclassified Gemella]|uniref:threonine/serine exporter family protein n=1 Tax=unclassified Gemella TaxID=2624949 RepID=UPI001C04BF2B|nr:MULTISPECIES: threonine/serine exporter family protein [unclassified Gemella]MBU0279056.1 threonine/serine exporter family protein [Gemella sp. zg-1178]QWQ38778.1 threonine/serine exporter family protein [Gemella sp. zg-570]